MHPQTQSFDPERVATLPAYTYWVCQAGLQLALNQNIASAEHL